MIAAPLYGTGASTWSAELLCHYLRCDVAERPSCRLIAALQVRLLLSLLVNLSAPVSASTAMINCVSYDDAASVVGKRTARKGAWSTHMQRCELKHLIYGHRGYFFLRQRGSEPRYSVTGEAVSLDGRCPQLCMLSLCASEITITG